MSICCSFPKLLPIDAGRGGAGPVFGRLCPPHYFQPPRFLDDAVSLLPLLTFNLIVSRIQYFCTNRQLMRFYNKNINEDLKKQA